LGLITKLKSVLSAVEERLGLRASLVALGQRPVPSQARVHLALGGAIFILLIVEAVTGLALATTYVPSTTDAWGSVFYIQEELTWGHLVRGIHYHGASMLLVLIVLQLSHMIFCASYRPPYEASWLIGCFLLLVVMFFGVTGLVLPWDQQGYWANQTELNILETVPGGHIIRSILAGGEQTGNQTLTRFYTLHAYILPAATLVLLWLQHRARHTHGFAASRQEPNRTFWPYQAVWSLLAGCIALTVVCLLALTVGVHLDAPADPASVYEARPKWYLLWLFKLLQYFDGPAALLATVVVPVIALSILLSIPFIDRQGTGTGPPKKVWVPLSLLLIFVGGLTATAMLDDAQSESYTSAKASAHADAIQAIRMAKEGGINAEGKVILHEGLRLFSSKGCKSCHKKDAKEKQGPLLRGYGLSERITRFLENPDHPDFFGRTVFKGSMDTFIDGYDGTTDDLRNVATWLVALSGKSVDEPERVKKGYMFFKTNDYCTECHNDPNTSFDHNACFGGDCDTSQYRPGLEGPDLQHYQSYEWTRAVIVNAGHQTLFGGVLDNKSSEKAMPAYPNMSPTDLDILTQWLLAGAPGAD
jgi:ubiquinol-cytochrome c reductase cytochrome b subunit